MFVPRRCAVTVFMTKAGWDGIGWNATALSIKNWMLLMEACCVLFLCLFVYVHGCFCSLSGYHIVFCRVSCNGVGGTTDASKTIARQGRRGQGGGGYVTWA